MAEEVAKNQIHAPAHSFLEGWACAVPGLALTARPGPILSLHGPAQDAQNGDGDGMTHPASIFPAADIQPIMSAVLNAPVLAGQLQQARRIGLVRAQTGNDPNRFHFLPAALELADALQPRQLHNVRKAHLFGRDRHHPDAAPLDSAVALFNLEQLRGKNLPEGSVALVLTGRVDCL
jgi:hypothetical protein